MIHLLELFMLEHGDFWFADGEPIEKKDLIGKRIQRMVVSEHIELTPEQRKKLYIYPMPEAVKKMFGVKDDA